MRKVLFVHGRPAGHPLHAAYGKSVNSTFRFEDPWFRWHDKHLIAPLRYLAWIVNAIYFISFRPTIIITEGLRITLVIAKILSFGQIRLIALVDDESPYFIHSKFYSHISVKVNSWAYRQYNSWICIGQMETALLQSIVGNSDNIFTGHNGVSGARLRKLSLLRYSPQAKRIVFIGNIASPWRSWYKGLDIMLATVEMLNNDGYHLYFDIAGDIDLRVRNEVMKKIRYGGQIRFCGPISDVEVFLSGAALYLHTARGESWGITINEAMAAGIIPIVSEWTGAKECVEQVLPDLVVSLEPSIIAERIKEFLNMPDTRKMELSNRCRQVAENYTEETAVAAFQKAYREAVAV